MRRSPIIALLAALAGTAALPGLAGAAPAADEAGASPALVGPLPAAPGPAPAGAAAPAASLPSDHDLVVGHLGVDARRIAATPYPLALRPSGCPSVTLAPPPCSVDLGAVGLRYWKTRNLAWNAALALAAGSGRQGAMTLDTYFGAGPIVGVTLLLGNWRHLAVGATPEASLIYFRPGGGGGASKLVTFRAQLEGELHFGFIDVPALSIGITTGLAFQYESAPGVSSWSVSVGEARSVWGALSNLFIRYYL